MAHLDFDLTSVIPMLEENSETKRLAKKLKRLLALHSIKQDLLRVQRTLSWLIEEGVARRSAPNQVIELTEKQSIFDASLSTYLFLNYARCTDTSSDTRSHFDPRRYFSDEEKIWHEDIISHRNESLAHYGPGSHRAGPWAKDTLHYMFQPETLQSQFCARFERANYKSLLLAHLDQLLPKVIDGLSKDMRSTSATISTEIGKNEAAWVKAVTKVTPIQSDAPWDGWIERGALGPPGFDAGQAA